MSRCEKHDRRHEIRQMEHGKTMYVCPECENERIDKFKKLFGVSGIIESPKFPPFYG